MLERRAGRRKDAGFAQHRQRAVANLHVQLVPRRLVERALLVSADLRLHTEVPQQSERAPGGRRAREVEVHRHMPAAEVPGTGRMEERRELGVAAAATNRRDLRELVSQLFREHALAARIACALPSEKQAKQGRRESR